MKKPMALSLIAGLTVLAAGVLLSWAAGCRGPRESEAPTGQQGNLRIDYPEEGSIFPPEFPPPTFLWRDAEPLNIAWRIQVSFADGRSGLLAESRGDRLAVGEVDPRCIAPTNEIPKLTPLQAEQRAWKPDRELWEALKAGSKQGAATVTITGYQDRSFHRARSRGQVTLRTSKDPVGAPIFYRDVPLMPTETEKGVIKPLSPKAVPLIAWRLRNVAETSSRMVMEGLYSCANCHSFSNDGSTMGMDVDGPQNDKGLYALLPVRSRMSIRSDDVVVWSTYRGKLGGRLRVAFMSQVSPDGRYVITTINDPAKDQTSSQRRKNPRDVLNNYYVTNFKDYRFLQVFYPTRGILAWYSRDKGHLQPLPGADDPGYVHTNAVWSPDGKYLVFSRASAKDAYPPDGKLPAFANDRNETQIQYDLYRIPFNGGEGGRPEPVRGASHNGMSNSFAKISPDGRWIVFVQARNGQLMRPDSRLFIIPASGGQARLMRCNTSLMNSWHSFSPNSRWMVFSSKSRSPYTQMYLTHLDETGNDSPAILIENATAANRAVNIPEFVNIPQDGIERIDVPVAEYYRLADIALEMTQQGRFAEVIPVWREALQRSPAEPLAHNNLGVALAETGKSEEAIGHYRKALELDPYYPDAHNNLGEALVRMGRYREAAEEFRAALKQDPDHTGAQSNLGALFAQQGRTEQALPHLRRAVELQPESARTRRNLGLALASAGMAAQAIPHLERAVQLPGGGEPATFDLLGRVYAQAGRYREAVQAARRAMSLAERQHDRALVDALKSRIASYESHDSAPRP